MKRAQRTDKPSNIPWRITIKPQGNGDVTIVLPVTTDCNADGAICTGDGQEAVQLAELHRPRAGPVGDAAKDTHIWTGEWGRDARGAWTAQRLRR